MKRAVLTQVEQIHLQKSYVLVREAIQHMMHIDKDRKLTSALNKIFDAADIMDTYIEPVKEENDGTVKNTASDPTAD